MNQIEQIVNQLTLKEKLALISGKDFWHLQSVDQFELPSIMMTDGPHGLRKQLTKGEHIGLSESVHATCYPTASLLASTWDLDLIFDLGKHLGKECLSERVSVLLGPGTNIKRSPLCGRNFEYFSEDPILSGRMAAAWINGLQSQGIGASLKHFALNNQESHRMVVDTVVDDRTMYELYLKPFEIAVKEANPWTVMCSYNQINGVYSSENKLLLTDILKNEWKYKGLTVTDWGAANNRILGVKAGLDLEMPGSHGIHHRDIIKALKNQTLSEEELNLAVTNVLKLIEKSNEVLKQAHQPYSREEHHEFARKVASEGIVLLKNDNHILPIDKSKKIALLGAFSKNPRYQGNGSSLIKPTKLSSLYDALRDRLGTSLNYADGYSIQTDEIHQELMDEAVDIAQKSDIVIIMAGLTESYESEGFDRKHLNMPKSHHTLIEEISKIHQNVIVILSNGAPILMPWKNSVNGIIEGYLGGQASGLAIADILFGDVNPSGKLAETFPNHLQEFPASKFFPGEPRQVIYQEGLYVGYRAYDAMNLEPLFPFGHGLSYTIFDYTNLNIVIIDDQIQVKFTLENTGDYKGKEIIQVYTSYEDSLVYRPKQELKAFKKIELEPHASKEIEINIPINDLSIYQEGFKIENGCYHILIGSSSRDIRLKGKVKIESKDIVTSDQALSYHHISKSIELIKEDYKQLLKRDIPKPLEAKPYHLNSTLGEIKNTMIGKMLYNMVNKEYGKIAGPNPTLAMIEMLESSVKEMPIRSLILFSDGKLSKVRAQGMIDILNHRYIRGLWKLISG